MHLPRNPQKTQNHLQIRITNVCVPALNVPCICVWLKDLLFQLAFSFKEF
jgi:hypothetical protein